MKFMKQTFYLLCLSLILVITSCSDTTDVEEFSQDEANLVTDISDDIDTSSRIARSQDCSQIPAPIDHLVTNYVITYKAGVTEPEKQAIRDSFSSYIYCIDTLYNPDNLNIELWVYKDCTNYPNLSSCRPKNQKPEDPDIRDVTEQ